ncbi:MAG: universal stress protein [Pseudomonadota bacterium]
MANPILVPVDVEFEVSWREALTTARGEATRRGAQLHVLGVVPDFGTSLVASYFPEGYGEKMRTDAAAALQKLAEEMLGDAVTWQVHVLQGDPVKSILAEAEKLDAELIVMAAHSPGERGFLTGTHADHVVAGAECSVYVVRRRGA